METPPQAGDERVAAVIDRLLSAGEFVDTGEFSLDTVAAAAKLKKFRYRDRDAYLTPLIEAVFGLGAQFVDVRSHGADLEVTAWPVECNDAKRRLFELFRHALGDPTQMEARAISRLAVAVDMATGIDGIARVAIMYVDEVGRVTAEYRRDQAPSIRTASTAADAADADADAHAAPAVRGPPRGKIQIFVERPWTEALTLHGVHATALAYLRDAVRFSKRSVEVDGMRISQHPRVLDLVRYREGSGLFGWACFGDHREPSSIELWFGDTCVERIPAPGNGFQAVIELKSARRDLSQMTVIRTPELASALEWSELARQSMLGDLRSMAEGWIAEGDWPTTLPRHRVDALLEPIGGAPRGSWFVEKMSALDRRGLNLGRLFASAALYGLGIAVVAIDVDFAVLPPDAPRRLNEYDGAVAVWVMGSIPLWVGAFLLPEELFRKRLLKDDGTKTTRLGVIFLVLGYVLAWLW